MPLKANGPVYWTMFATRGYYRVRSQSFSTFPYSSRITIPHQPPRLVYLILNTSAFARFLDELIGSIDGCQEFLVHVSPHMLLNLVRILASFRIHAVKGPEIESLSSKIREASGRSLACIWRSVNRNLKSSVESMHDLRIIGVC